MLMVNKQSINEIIINENNKKHYNDCLESQTQTNKQKQQRGRFRVFQQTGETCENFRCKATNN